MSTARGRRAAAAAERLAAVPTPREGEWPPDTVPVPRGLADDMAAAIVAMQVLASESMLEVAMSLGMAARRPATPLPPPCDSCRVEVGIGFPHDLSCRSPEARRLRTQAVPRIIP